MIDRNIFFINQYATSLEDGFGGRSLAYSLAISKYVKSVTLVCAAHHHLQNKKNSGGSPRSVNLTNFQIIKLFTLPRATSRNIFRFINWFLFAVQIMFTDKRLKIRPDIIIYSSPSPIGFLGAFILSRRCSAKIIYEVRDIWPLTLVTIGKKSKFHPFVYLLGKIEKFAYSKCDGVISNLMGVEKHIKNTIHYSRPFLYSPTIAIPQPKGSIKKVTEHETLTTLKKISKSKFIVGYCGTIGFANCLGNLINSAKYLRDNKNILFVIIGRGALKAEIEQVKKSEHLENVIILPAVPKVLVGEVIKCFDIGYLGWHKSSLYEYGVGANKMIEYLSCGTPIIHAYSGAYDLVDDAGLGVSVPAENGKALADAICGLSELDNTEYQDLKQKCTTFSNEYFDTKKRVDELLCFIDYI